MKRSWCLSLWMSIVTCAILVATAQPVKAATTPTPPPASGLPTYVKFGTPVTSVPLSKTVPIGGNADFKVDSSQKLNIMKDFEDQGTVERLQYAASALTQKEVLQQYIDPPDPGYVWSGVIRICRSTGGADSTEVTQSRFVTKVDSEKHLLSDLYNVSGKIAAIFPGYSLSKDDTGNYIQAKKPSVIDISYQPPCDTNGTGITAVPKPISLAEGWFTSLLHWFFSSPGGGSQTVTATAVGKEVSDGANRFVKLLTGKDVGPVTDLPPEEQPKVSAARGALASLLPGNATFKSDNGQIPNFSVSATVTTPTPAPIPTGTAKVLGETTDGAIPVNFPEGYVKDYDTQTLCWATQKGDPRRPPDCKMTTIRTSANSGDVCAVAAQYHIPCCQLKGIMQVESGGGSGTCSSDGETCCTGNFCGPANISCNQYSGLNSGDNLKMCTETGATELLARAMLLARCQADANTGQLPAGAPPGACQSYDWSKWGSFILQHYTISDGDYTAAAYFYGLGHGCAVDACSQFRWGTGKGYCDAVAGYCPGGTPLADSTDVSYCEACNATIPASSPKINCSLYQ